jgi:hypothetical protein
MPKSYRLRTAVAVVVLAGYLLQVALPAARGGGSFAVYYIAAALLAHQPSALARVDDDAWFAAQLGQINPPGVYDIFFYNPPTMSLLMLPLGLCFATEATEITEKDTHSNPLGTLCALWQKSR